MGCHHRRISVGSGRGTSVRLAGAAGFLTLLLHFLMFSAVAGPVEESLGNLDRLETARNGILAQADSLGRLVSIGPDRGSGRQKSLLREIDRLSERSRDLEVEILLERQRCRSLAVQELAALAAQNSSDLERRRALDEIVDRRLADRSGADWVWVEPDSADGVETLLDKQAYLKDLRDRIQATRSRVNSRVERLRRERSLLRASEGFADEARFLDEGGRVGSDERALLRGVSGAPLEGGSGRVPGSGGGGAEQAPFPAAAGSSTAPSGDPLASLLETRGGLDADLERANATLDAIDRLLSRYGATPR